MAAYAYYNEHDPYAAAWLRNLIAAGHIANGYVDERSIADVLPSDLAGFTQCHFFAGIGAWSYALRRAGWPDERAVWTGSCPCQPFSDAGAGRGFDDERHLWPHWHHLIRVCRPPNVFGEQVASKDGLGWLDLVQADMEGEAYALWPVDMCAAGVGAPHIRQRLWLVGVDTRPLADDDDDRFGASGRARRELPERDAQSGGADFRLDHHHHQGSQGHTGHGGGRGERPGPLGSASATGISYRLPDATSSGWREECADGRGRGPGDRAQERAAGHSSSSSIGGMEYAHSGSISLALGQPHQRDGQRPDRENLGGGTGRPGPTNGPWGTADWLLCRDAKWRPVEPGTFPLAHGAASRVGRLRAYGNAIVAEAAEAVIGAYLDHEGDVVADRGSMLIGHNGGPAFEDLLG